MDSEQRQRQRTSHEEDRTVKPRRGPGRQTPGQTRQRNLELLDTALDHFFERGFDGASIEGISAAAGMAKRTVYLRYGDKTRLFKAALQRAIELWIVPIERLRAVETADLDETLLRIGQILVANVLSPGGLRLLRITNAESGRMPEIGQFTYKQGTAPTVAYLTDLIRRRVGSDGTVQVDPEQAAYAFLYLVVGGPASLTAWGISLDKAAIDKQTRYAVSLFLHGVLHATTRTATRHAGKRKQPLKAPPLQLQHETRLNALEEENKRLKLLLADAVLEAARLKGEPRAR
jgi:TetR/AcrR family transcriptional repressor of mexJK operon